MRKLTGSKADEIMEKELDRREDTKKLIIEICERDTLNWEQRMVLVNSVISYEYEQLKPKGK